ncbi:DUF6783 domain-containing protein [Blautia faecis]
MELKSQAKCVANCGTHLAESLFQTRSIKACRV